MARKYIRQMDGGVDYLTVHKRMTGEEFVDRKKKNKDAIKAIDAELRQIKPAELPGKATELQTLAIIEFNFSVDRQIEALLEKQSALEVERELMEKI